jgi:uncharacterized protein (TIGR03435 family)
MSTGTIVATLFGIAVALGPQTGVQSPAFDSVTIHRNTSGQTRSGLRLMPDGGVTATNATLREVIQLAYQRHAFDRRQIEGGPGWIDTDRFDIVAHATGGHVFEADSFPRQTWLMLRSVLEDRFKLQVRNQPRPVPVYELRMARAGTETGPRLRKVDVDCGTIMKMKVKDEPRNGLQAGRPVCAVATYPGRIVADALTMPAFASVLSGTLDRVVVDRTGLAGSFELELEAVEIKAPGPVGPSYRPSETTQSIFSAMPEQLGLKLEAGTGPVDVLVIESAELPPPDKNRP